MGKGLYPRTPETDSCNTIEDLGRHFVRQWVRNNPKDKEFVLMSDNKKVLKAYELMVTRVYETKEQF